MPKILTPSQQHRHDIGTMPLLRLNKTLSRFTIGCYSVLMVCTQVLQVIAERTPQQSAGFDAVGALYG